MDLSICLSCWHMGSGKGLLALVTQSYSMSTQEDGLCPGPGQRSSEPRAVPPLPARKGATVRAGHTPVCPGGLDEGATSGVPHSTGAQPASLGA